MRHSRLPAAREDWRRWSWAGGQEGDKSWRVYRRCFSYFASRIAAVDKAAPAGESCDIGKQFSHNDFDAQAFLFVDPTTLRRGMMIEEHGNLLLWRLGAGLGNSHRVPGTRAIT